MMRAIDTLAGRMFLLLLLGAVLAAGAALAVSDATHRHRLAQLHVFTAAERVGDLAGASVSAGGSGADGLAQALPAARPAAAGRPDPALTRAVAGALRRRGVDDVDVAAFEASAQTCGAAHGRDGVRCRILTLTEPDATTPAPAVALSLPARPSPLAFERNNLLGLIVAFGMIALAAWVASRLAAGPLNRLSAAAVALGEDLDRPPLREEGSHEVREAAAAFNAMQARLKAMVQDRTRVLAAVTHDLQTPLTRLRLRVEKVQDPALRDRLIADLAATQALVREGLELARIEHVTEDWAVIDIDALLAALAEDGVDAGQAVDFTGGCGRTVRGRPNALRRCLVNLIDNAVKHGRRAEVSCAADATRVILTIRDHGPGIPEDQIASVFEPFFRLDPSRSRDHGGTGLGLTIAARMAEQTGAVLSLRNADDGGLIAALAFRA